MRARLKGLAEVVKVLGNLRGRVRVGMRLMRLCRQLRDLPCCARLFGNVIDGLCARAARTSVVRNIVEDKASAGGVRPKIAPVGRPFPPFPQ